MIVAINNATVTVYAASPNGAMMVGNAITDASGTFAVKIAPAILAINPGHTYFVIAQRGQDLVLAIMIGTQIFCIGC